MLKIKSNVDLKELEKFGFEKVDVCYEYRLNNHDANDYSDEVYVVVYSQDFRKYKERELYLYVEDVPTDELFELDVLFDLIQSGLVEKV